MLNQFLFFLYDLKAVSKQKKYFCLSLCISPFLALPLLVTAEGQWQYPTLFPAGRPESCVPSLPVRAFQCTQPHNIITDHKTVPPFSCKILPQMQESIIYKTVSGSKYLLEGLFILYWFVLVRLVLLLTARLLFLISSLPGAEETAELYSFPKNTAFNWMLIYKWLFPLWYVFIRGIFKCMLSFD